MITLESNPTSPPTAGKPIPLRQLLFVTGTFLTLLLCGCASRSHSHWKMQSFAIATPPSEPGSAAHTNILSLHRVTVSPLFEGQPFVYRTGENTYERDPYAGFFVSPNRMFEQSLRTSLGNGHAFEDVLDPGSSLKSSCSMEVSVSQLYGDFREPNHPFAVLQLHFLVFSTDPANRGHVLWQREFSRRLPISHRTPAALLAGWNEALQQIMTEVNAELNHLAVP